MANRRKTAFLQGAVVGCLAAAPAWAEADFATQFQTLLASARTGDAAALATERLAAAPGDAQAQFALGAAQFLGAIEGLGQAMYRHGLTQSFNDGGFGIPGVTDLPFLRLPVPANPAPEPFSAPVFRQILGDFDAGLASAEATLAAVPKGEVELPLNVALIRLDMNGDGMGGEMESLPMIIYAISGVFPGAPEMPVTFDAADVPWLRGYAHLLAGITGILLAHDWTETVEQTFQAAFPASPLAARPLNDALGPMREAIAKAEAAGDCDYPSFNTWDHELTAEEQARLERFDACRTLRDATRYGGIGDLVAFVHLWHWPVVDAPRLITARQHFLTMITLSRESWALILAETDDNHEWVPGPKQHGPFPNMRVTEETVAGWMDFLDQAEGVLDGRYLIPHWRFPPDQGVNIRRLFEEPRALDPILMLTGSGAIPYIETGTMAPGSTLDTGMALLEGGPLAYFFWFN